MSYAMCAPRERALAAMMALLIMGGAGPGVLAETIRIQTPGDPGNPQALAGAPYVFWVLLDDNTTPIYSYGLDLRLIPNIVGGPVEFDVAATGFFEERNVIVQGGGALSASKTAPTLDGSFLLSASNSAFDNVPLAVDGFSDGLAKVVVNVPADAEGSFTIALEDLDVFTMLVHLDPQTFEFTQLEFAVDKSPVTIQIIPEPVHLGILGGLLLLLRRQRR